MLLGFMSLLMLGACNATPPTDPPTIHELTVVPDIVQKNIVATDRIQLLHENDAPYYLVYYSKGNVLADITAEGNRLIIQLEEGSEQRKEAHPYVFQITVKNPELDTIDLRINGHSTPIDRMTIM